jgi:hypothetical protein
MEVVGEILRVGAANLPALGQTGFVGVLRGVSCDLEACQSPVMLSLPLLLEGKV